MTKYWQDTSIELTEEEAIVLAKAEVINTCNHQIGKLIKDVDSLENYKGNKWHMTIGQDQKHGIQIRINSEVFDEIVKITVAMKRKEIAALRSKMVK